MKVTVGCYCFLFEKKIVKCSCHVFAQSPPGRGPNDKFPIKTQLPICVKMFHSQYHLVATVIRIKSPRCQIYMYVLMYLCMYVCMYVVYMYVCMYVYIYIHTHTHTHTFSSKYREAGRKKEIETLENNAFSAPRKSFNVPYIRQHYSAIFVQLVRTVKDIFHHSFFCNDNGTNHHHGF